MMIKSPGDTVTFASEVSLQKIKRQKNWKILVVDDEKDIHSLTSLLLKNMEFNKKGFKIFDAYSASEAKKIIAKNPDIQLILLDVVMETPDAGLEFVKYIREELGNNFTRIIIRTGQPGLAPHSQIFNSYDINNYANKVELSADGFSMLILSEIKNYYKQVESVATDDFEKKRLTEEISEHIQIEELLKESENRFKSLLDSAVGWEYWISDKGEIKYSSPSCQKITGYTPEEFITKKIRCLDIIHPDDIDLFLSHRLKEFQSPSDLTCEYRIIDKNGNEKVLYHSCHAVYDGDGKFLGRRVSNHDITSKKTKEEAIRKSEERLKELNQNKDKLFSVIAHDLKSPFLSILGFTEILTEEIEKIKDKDLLSLTGNINHSVKKVYELLENLLTWSRLQNDQIHFSPDAISIYDITAKIFELYKIPAINKNVELINDLDRDTTVFADYFMVDTIIRNLVNNSVKFTDSGGFIRISSSVYKHYEKICIEDNGVGISLENQQKLFSGFDRHCQTTVHQESGSGIGLLLCKEFIEKNNGKIEIHSEPGVGSRFYFTLPLTEK